MKKLVVALLVLLLAVGLVVVVGCGGEKETTVDTPATTSPAPEPVDTSPQESAPATDVYPTVDMSGIPEQLQMEIWYEAVAMEDQISIYDPDEREKLEAAEATLCAKYGITQLQLDKIVWDAMEEDWPMPPMPE